MLISRGRFLRNCGRSGVELAPQSRALNIPLAFSPVRTENYVLGMRSPFPANAAPISSSTNLFFELMTRSQIDGA
jgi:hypothetical protein